MSNPQIQNLSIQAGMKVTKVMQEGSEAQKVAAPLFDLNHDGIFDEKEAKLMNSSVFSLGKNTLTINEGNKTTELKYDNLDQLYHTSTNYKGEKEYNNTYYWFNTDKSAFSYNGTYKKRSIDLTDPNMKVTMEGVKEGELKATNTDLTVKNSDVKRIDISGGALNLENVKNKGKFNPNMFAIDPEKYHSMTIDQPTLIREKDDSAKVTIDKDSDVYTIKNLGNIKINPGMSVNEVKRTGSQAQAIAAPLFDVNHDGILDEKEAKAMNSGTYTLKGKEFIMQFGNKTSVLKFDSLDKFYEDYSDYTPSWLI